MTGRTVRSKGDTPAARARREAAAKPETQPVVTGPARAVKFGRRLAQGESAPALIASAARIDMRDKKSIESTRRRRQAWQSEAWDYMEEVGEIGYTVTWIGNLLSKLRLFAAVRPDPAEAPMAVDDPKSGVDPTTAKIAMDTLARLRSPEGGQSALIRMFGINLEVAGELYLHGREDPVTGEEEWYIRSVDELVITGDTFALRGGPGQNASEPIPADDVVIRMWERSARFGNLATCAMRRVLGEAESLLLLSREIRAGSKSRLSNGLLLLPSELSFGPADPTRDSADGEETDDPFEAELQLAMITPIQEEGSAAAVVPLVIRGPADYLDKVRHLALDKSLDPVLDTRIEARVLRIARGLNAPTEVTTGYMATTFANASTIKQSEFDDHLEPRAVLISDCCTAGYFQPALIDAGVDPQRAKEIFVWYDASGLIAHPDQAEQAELAHKDGIISDAARRRYVGFTEADAPTDDEILRRLMLKASRMDPNIYAQLLKISGLADEMMIPAPVGGIIVEPGDPTPIIIGGANPTAKSEEPGGPAAEIPPPPAPVIKALGPGEPVVPANPPPGPQQNPAVPAPQSPDKVVPGPKPVTAAGAPSRDWKALGPKLSELDRSLRLRVHGALDQATRRALERAGHRIQARVQRDKGGATAALKRVADSEPAGRIAAAIGPSLLTAAGLTDAELLAGSFGPVVDDVCGWLAIAQIRAVAHLSAVAGSLPPATAAELAHRQAAGLSAARAWLVEALPRMAAARLYEPNAGPEFGEHDPTVLVPQSVARAAVGLAGGSRPRGGEIPIVAAAWVDVGPLVADGGEPFGGPGTGPDLMAAASDVGGEVEAYEWQYGASERVFEPHLNLDGEVFQSFDDNILVNNEDWPDTSYFIPGDHDGCQCDVSPIMIPMSEVDGSGDVPVDAPVEDTAPTDETIPQEG